MNFGDWPKAALRIVTTLWAAALLALAPQVALAQDEAADAPVAAAETTETEAAEAPAYTPLGPEHIKGVPEAGGIDFQPQYTDDGQFAYKMHTYLLVPVITVISLFVLALLLWVVVRYRRKANPEPSKTTHNTFIEVVWTLVPVLILVGIAIPSITLLARQFETAPEDAVTIKATGYQWYWGYSYPDYGEFEVISNMLSDEDADANGEPRNLAVDNRMVVPANTPIRLQTTSADVIHAFAVPSLWFKIDAVPGRLNERLLTINEPGIYYGQCSELCGIKHGFMPIAVEALPREQFEAWIVSKGGTIGGADAAAEDAQSAADAAAAGDAAGAVEAETAEAAAE
ncbi:cytochrome c oxidase subunit II [Pontixanthobacter aquaemixtae]|uniref:Cytochrome c oxidase subunit 2 n=1 Tax=Pontixanthobacter aquaemixtae TaxID=1958940 RepID=A0A844ZRK4_9SPHN|nr:cytochrome c oxidase subunit II [Pontixanthobacter aquaemixtae]MXO89720.1 cytochrome c oxidase subunit II [Pontixanthobacter aquaemixtae]